MFLLPALAIAAQPDLGTAILVAGAGMAVLMLAGLSWRYLGYAFFLIAAAAPLLWQFALQGYQRQRIITLFDPESDPLGAGWNIIQSTTAIGSGGVFGKGLLQGTQSHLDFLPEARTDFIIAVVGEELGLVGVLCLLPLLGDHSQRFSAGGCGPEHFCSLVRGCFDAHLFHLLVREHCHG